MKGIILAAGDATALRPATRTVAKATCPSPAIQSCRGHTSFFK